MLCGDAYLLMILQMYDGYGVNEGIDEFPKQHPYRMYILNDASVSFIQVQVYSIEYTFAHWNRLFC